MKIKILISAILLFAGLQIFGQTKVFYKFDIKQDISQSAWRTSKKAMDEAARIKADYILIHMNTYGGLVDAADSIRTAILNSKIPVWVFIDNNAASAGALISLACDSIYMRQGASIGAATVVDQNGQVVPDKYQAYMRSKMRATAEAHGKDTIFTENDTIIKWFRDPMIAEAMVDPRTYIPNINDSGKVLTFTTEEAIKHGYCEGQASNITEVIEKTGIKEYKIVEHKVSTMDNIIGFLMNPYLQGILIMLIVAGIYFEMQSPGLGFPIIVAITAAVTYFAPLYLEGLAEHWEILLFIVGVGLIAVELFAIPGFGVTGISGILLVIASLTLSMVDNVTFTTDSGSFLPLFKALVFVLLSILISLVASIFIGVKLMSVAPFQFLVLDTVQKPEEGFVNLENSISSLVGKMGTAHTVLRPSGKVEIENEIYDAKSEYGFIEKGEKVKVVRHEASQIYVVKA